MLGLSRRTLAAATVLASLGVLAWLLLGDSDEAKVMARLQELARAVETSPEENMAFRALRVKKAFEAGLEPNVGFRAPELEGANGVKDLTALAAGVPRIYGQLDINIGESDVRIDGASREANVVSAVTLTGIFGGEVRRETRRVRFSLRESGGDWRVDFIEVEARTDEQPEARP